jgi:hypothetical protein
MENEWMINPAETPPDGHTPDLTITRLGAEQLFLEPVHLALQNLDLLAQQCILLGQSQGG